MIEALEAVDTAELMFFIFNRGVNFFQAAGKSYVQSKLSATDEADEHSNGTGVVEASVTLYQVSQKISGNLKEKKRKKLGYMREPENPREVCFFMNQTILRTIKD